ncbi:MAG: gluconate 2-dehydrogenase subunit 3 family protein [Acidobacteriota bacterium]|nr:gluconate 2-dehydrogenase subunit 3 family protein [Acidobacteriota bacterium]
MDEIRDSGRRNALKKLATGAGAASIFPILGQASASRPAHGQAAHAAMEMNMGDPPPVPDPNWKPLFFDAHQNETVIALTELIIPATDTPGAKAALVNRTIDLFLNDEEADTQKEFLEGLSWIDGRAIYLHGKPFLGLTEPEQTALLEPLSDPSNQKTEDLEGVKFFQAIKDATLFGYYTSQIGLDQELHYGGDDYHDSFPGACTHPEHQS